MKRKPKKPATKVHAPIQETGNDEGQAACYLGCSNRWLRDLRLKQRGLYDRIAPRHYKIGRLVRYRKADLDAFIEAQSSKPAA